MISNSLFACVVSKHDGVKTQLYEISVSKNFVLPKRIQIDIPDITEHVITESRKLLYDTYITELGWNPPKNTSTNFVIEDGQLKDRFDDVGIWVCIINEISNTR